MPVNNQFNAFIMWVQNALALFTWGQGITGGSIVAWW